MNNLLAIAEKAPIVPTFSARALRAASAEVRDTYSWHAATHVEQPALATLRQAFVDAVRQSQTPKACLVAPFGYGKTASAIGLWSACTDANLLVVPPVSCGSFTELAGAVYNWLAFTLTSQADVLSEAHDTFLVSTAETLARHDERVFGIPFDQALISIRDKLERGYLDFDDVSINLLAFFEQATAVVCQAGYDGLVVMIDEVQQLLGNANKGVLVALRQLIWGLRTRKIPFGLLLTMDPDTERTLSDRAGDILHRIKDDGLYLDIRNIYDRDFPGRLWHQYTSALGLSTVEQRAIDHATLEALGQLCERDDLSNGPRTVINALQRAAERWTMGAATSYTPIDLIDDLLDGTIRFDGDRGVIPALVADLLNFPYFQRSAERTRTLKLIAAFPRGCSVQVAQQYGLEQTWHELDDDLRGEIVTETDEGLALIELQRVGRPANKLNILLRRYWMQITDQQLFTEDATRVFNNFVLPLIFPPKVNDLNGWHGLNSVQLTPHDTYAGIIEGTSTPTFPLRRIAVEILAGDLQPQSIGQPNDVDVSMVFCLNLDPTAQSTLLVDSDKMEIIFTLAVGRVSTQGLRGGIAWIEHYLSPHPISAAVILSLLRYLGREGIDNLPERDSMKIEDTISRLQEWLLAEIFPTTLFEAAGYSVVYTGCGALKEFLYLLLSRRWPRYEPLARLPIWSSLLADYEYALTQLSPTVQIGSESVRSTKAEVAKLFRQNRHAGFQSHARQYGVLLHIETWQGDLAAIRFVPHPAELQLAERVRSQRSIPEYEVYLALRRTGFAAAETEQLMRLALARGLVQRQGNTLTAPAAISAAEINMRVQALRTRAGRIDTIPKEVLDDLETFAGDTEQHRNAATAAWHLEQLEREVSRLEAEAAARADARREVVRRQLLNALPRLTTPLQNVPQSSSIEKHLAAVYRELNHERLQLKNAADTFIQAPKQQLNIEDGEVLAERVVAHCNQADLYDRWVSFAQQIEVLEGALERLGKHGEALSDLSTRIRELMRSAKSVLAEIGLSGLSEVDWLQAKLIEIDQTFRSLADARRVAYQHVAGMLATEVTELINLHCEIPIPTYDPENDEYSFCVLYRNITKVVGRSLALLSMSLSDEDESTNQGRRSLAKLRSDIGQTVQQLTEPGWLIAAPNPYVRTEARARLRSIRERVSARMHVDTPKARLRNSLITALSNLPTGPTEVTTLIANLNGITTSEALLRDLLQLHETGHLRLMIDLPSDTEQKAK